MIYPHTMPCLRIAHDRSMPRKDDTMTTPTPDQPTTDAAEMTTARPEDVIAQAMADARAGRVSGTDRLYAKVIVKALAEAGYVIVERDDLEMAVEWMDQTMNPFGDDDGTWADALLTRDNLKDALAARQEDSDGR